MSVEGQSGGVGRSGAVARLSVMMFLQFFFWGAWFVTLGPFMTSLNMGGEANLGKWIGNAYSTAPLAAILAPFFLGIVADRFFASQRVMGALHIVGGLLLVAAPVVAKTSVQNPLPFVGVLLLHMLCYMPTLGLSNTVSFNAMSNPEKQFPLIRVWGTIGWIAAGFAVAAIAAYFHPYSKYLVGGLSLADFEAGRASLASGQTLAEDVMKKVNDTVAATQTARSGDPQFFYAAGACGVLLGFFSFALPHTPPPMKGKPLDVGAILGRDAFKLLADRSFLVFALASLLICIPLAAYYSFGSVYVGAVGWTDVPIKMTFGQMSEIFFMLVMPLFFVRLGVKWMLAIGMLAWVIRYGLFAGAWSGAEPIADLKWMVLAGVILHGICYDFFFVTGQIYVEKRANPEIRGQAQGFLVLITQGIGMLIGNQCMGPLKDYYTKNGETDWRSIWMVPCIFAGAVMLIFILAFRNDKKTAPEGA